MNCELRINYSPKNDTAKEILSLIDSIESCLADRVFHRAIKVLPEITVREIEQQYLALNKGQEPKALLENTFWMDLLIPCVEFANLENEVSSDHPSIVSIRGLIADIATTLYQEGHCTLMINFVNFVNFGE